MFSNISKRAPAIQRKICGRPNSPLRFCGLWLEPDIGAYTADSSHTVAAASPHVAGKATPVAARPPHAGASTSRRESQTRRPRSSAIRESAVVGRWLVVADAPTLSAPSDVVRLARGPVLTTDSRRPRSHRGRRQCPAASSPAASNPRLAADEPRAHRWPLWSSSRRLLTQSDNCAFSNFIADQ